MARNRKLKVFRTPIGFHDAYVAAPSQKAALRAWGSDADLFARGIAEQIEDPELMKKPLAHPGEVIRRSRGSAAEQLAALPKNTHRQEKTPRTKDAEEPTPTQSSKTSTRPAPKPRRNRLDEVERALATAKASRDAEKTELDQKISKLHRDREALATKWERDREKLENSISAERERYERALRNWDG